MKVGAVVFDTSNNIRGSDRTIINLGSCWASIGGCKARRISAIHELPSDVIWFTNLSYNDFYKAGLHRHPNFRNDGWLRTSFNQLISELGVDNNLVTSNVTAEVVSTIAHRMVTYAMSKYQITPKNKRLNEDFADAFGAPKSQIDDNYYKFYEAIAEHPSVSVIPTMNFMRSSPTVTVRRNRLEHARDVLATPVPPDRGWELHKNIGSNKGDNWLETVDKPFLVKCSVTNLKPMLAEVLSWGSGAKSVRDWLTDIEWRVVRELGDIQVHSALICNHDAERLEQYSILPNEEYSPISITQGLVAENIWTSMCNKQHYRADAMRFTAAACWLRSADRMIMFDLAQKLYGRGLTVFSYGVGNVVLSYPENGLRRALDISLDFGLLPPANKYQEAKAETV